MRPTGEWLAQPGGLADRLKNIRKAAGLTGDQLAERLGWTRSKIPKLENGRQMPSEGDITAWAEACGQPESVPELLDQLAAAQAVHQEHRHRLRRGHATIQSDMDDLVRQAARVRNSEILLIPGLLQTPEYARYRMLEAVRVYGANEDGIDAAVAARMRRQTVLYEQGRVFEFAIHEAALTARVCPAPVMLGQLDRLLTASGLPAVNLAIIPGTADITVTQIHPFLIAGDVVHVETHASGIEVRGSEADAYGAIMDGLMAEGVTGDEARSLILRAAADLGQ